jgi:carbonic anhydrase/acetyltransferase-like protein (isoleucine patch superfamily)
VFGDADGGGCTGAAGRCGATGSLFAGVPGKVRRDLSDAEVAHNRNNAQVYQALIELHRDANAQPPGGES